MVNDDDRQYFAIVAEYRGVAVLEKRGDQRAVWQGQEYFTDGHAYIGWRDDAADEYGAYRMECEGDVKAFIDAWHDDPDNFGEEYRKRLLLSYRDVYQSLHKKPFVGEVPQYVFDSVQGVFVRVNGARDGQHRHQGLK
jgi:hypothetical protein